MGQLRKIQRRIVREETEAAPEVPDNHLKLPVGQILTEPVKGDFLTFPLFAWFGKRVKVGTPLLLINLCLFRSQEDPQPRGTLQIEIPIFEDTELAVLAALERYGWDGRAWPVDSGWPDGATDEEEMMRTLMEQAKLQATLTFPPNEELGVAAQAVTISRARGPFLMPPLPEPESPPTPERLAKFRELYNDPQKFLSTAAN